MKTKTPCSHAKTVWTGGVRECQLCNSDLVEGKVMIDGAVRSHGGQWACMCSNCWTNHGAGPIEADCVTRRLGTGFGQRYELQECGHWVKTGG